MARAATPCAPEDRASSDPDLGSVGRSACRTSMGSAIVNARNKRGDVIRFEAGGQAAYPAVSCDATVGSLAVRETSPSSSSKPRLLDRVREARRVGHYSRRTEKAYFIIFWPRRGAVGRRTSEHGSCVASALTRFPAEELPIASRY